MPGRISVPSHLQTIPGDEPGLVWPSAADALFDADARVKIANGRRCATLLYLALGAWWVRAMGSVFWHSVQRYGIARAGLSCGDLHVFRVAHSCYGVDVQQ